MRAEHRAGRDETDEQDESDSDDDDESDGNDDDEANSWTTEEESISSNDNRMSIYAKRKCTSNSV
jgi:hypothetical protein